MIARYISFRTIEQRFRELRIPESVIENHLDNLRIVKTIRKQKQDYKIEQEYLWECRRFSREPVTKVRAEGSRKKKVAAD
jgi:hypothetical protein